MKNLKHINENFEDDINESTSFTQQDIERAYMLGASDGSGANEVKDVRYGKSINDLKVSTLKKAFGITINEDRQEEYEADVLRLDSILAGSDVAILLMVDSDIPGDLKKKLESEYKIVIEKTTQDRYVVYPGDERNREGFENFNKDYTGLELKAE